MDKPKVLSGEELVRRGMTKLDSSLPEIGLKDVFPNGSWLEQKQIQSALEARKHLIEVERIEKCGAVSHAEWREELMLAEVTQKTGGYWQFLGHNVGKQLFLKPEEALFLIEVNCLQLKYNDVTVSLQQAYSLLLRSEITLLQYRVYSSLSRLGYKIYRHEEKATGRENNILEFNEDEEKATGNENDLELNEEKNIEIVKESRVEERSGESKKTDDIDGKMEIDSVDERENEDIVTSTENEESMTHSSKDMPLLEPTTSDIETNTTNTMQIESENVENGESMAHSSKDMPLLEPTISDIETNTTNTMQIESENVENGESMAHSSKDMPLLEPTTSDIENNTTNTMEIESENVENGAEYTEDVSQIKYTDNGILNHEEVNEQSGIYHNHRLHVLENRKLQPSNAKHIEQCFNNVPDVSQQQVVTVTVPEDKYFPKNVFLHNVKYVLNLKNITSKTSNAQPEPNEARPYNANDEVNGDHVMRIRDTVGSNNFVFGGSSSSINSRFRPNYQFRPQVFFRPHTTNVFPFNLFFQRTFMPNINFFPRFRVFTPRPPLMGTFPRFPIFPQTFDQRNSENVNRKRKRSNAKEIHLDAIKKLAGRLKLLVNAGNRQKENIDSLQRLINTFNIRYNMQLCLTPFFNIVNDETIVETISLDDDEEIHKKRSKTEEYVGYTENLNKVKQLALRLKSLEPSGDINSRHRRAFSQLVKRFNKSYNADVYVDNNFKVRDRKLISLDSSSDSDCILEEPPQVARGKKLKNPFSILKRLSKKKNSTVSTSSTKTPNNLETKNKYSEAVKENFGKNWLPSEEDFGRAEVLPKNLTNSYLIDTKKEEFLFDFMKSQHHEFSSWLDAKISFFKSVEETNTMITDAIAENASYSLITPEDGTDMPSVLKKLSIIKTCKECDVESSLSIDFDVYNRDVQNFKKSNKPKPHFRVVCLSESSRIPSGKDIASLHSKYVDNVSIIFAVVGIGSVSYLQMNPFDLPVYIPSNDLS